MDTLAAFGFCPSPISFWQLKKSLNFSFIEKNFELRLKNEYF